MKLHRAITLVVMILISLLAIGYSVSIGISSMNARSLVALGVVIVVAGIAGLAFSWRRYFPSRTRR